MYSLHRQINTDTDLETKLRSYLLITLRTIPVTQIFLPYQIFQATRGQGKFKT